METRIAETRTRKTARWPYIALAGLGFFYGIDNLADAKRLASRPELVELEASRTEDVKKYLDLEKDVDVFQRTYLDTIKIYTDISDIREGFEKQKSRLASMKESPEIKRYIEAEEKANKVDRHFLGFSDVYVDYMAAISGLCAMVLGLVGLKNAKNQE